MRPLVNTTLRLLTAVGLAAFSATASAANPPPTVRAEAPNVYVVKKGDTLWDISGRYLSEPWRWPEIWAVNKQISNPHLIYPGDRIILCVIQGRTLVGIDDGQGCAGLEARMTGAAAPMTRYESLGSAISAIPLSDIKPYFYLAQIVDPEPLKEVPYVLASKSGSIITAAGDTIYARGPDLIVGERYGVYREGDSYFDTETGKVLGQEVMQVAKGVVTSANDGISTLELQHTFREEVREGDKVFIDLDDAYQPIFYPKAGPANVAGKLLKVLGSVGIAQPGSVVTVDMGEADGVSAGDVFTIYRTGKTVIDKTRGDTVQLPSERSGSLMVFKTFDQLSYAYVLEADTQVKVGDQLISPEAFN